MLPANELQAAKYGPENASVLDKHAAMKSGFKNLDEHEKPKAPIVHEAQKRIVSCYFSLVSSNDFFNI